MVAPHLILETQTFDGLMSDDWHVIHLRNFQDQRGALLIAVIGAVVNKVKMAIISSCIKL